ncbi:alpha/beta fold hydrolase [Halostagnicola kamekurae]|uniref:Pimeloyl-ACP methyl ester carboxylesterase n=1 Tax=Halostagnicola kamekurae TaxID=619731 RepID=A0A1I6QD55_9EURY|nr:alpha/beta hydrolase [Halostagnicola kamekurae]SFS50228.1 Pimeloyl-ACP methyl ester carboxylesterase [Halostagnicola kamekurae]
MDTVTHHGRETAFVATAGERSDETICFVHGSGTSHTVWEFQNSLSDRYDLVSLDLSGHGASDDVQADAGYATLSAYSDDLLAVVEETDATAVVGSSLGGAVTLHALLERSFEPNAAILTGTGARMGVLEDLLAWLESDFERAIEFLHEPDRLFHDPNAELLEASRERMRECGRRTTARDFRTCHRFDVRADLGEIDVPTLAVCGEYDRLTPPWYHEFLADELPDGEYVTIDDAAHLPMLERPDAFNEALDDFVASR